MTATTFEALGTYVFLSARNAAALPGIQALATGILEDVDRTCSRFRADSDLTDANLNAGSWVKVDPILVAAVRTACAAAEQTSGLVNPLLGRPLEQLGYDRDFGLLHELEDIAFTAPTPPSLDAWRSLGLDDDGAIRVPTGTALDLGSTGKAWAADLIAAAIVGELGERAIVSLGGDIAIAAPEDSALEPWPISISTSPGGPVEQEITLDRGGLATSSTRVRRWARRGVRLHHLLDPRTGLPVATGWRTVTATGPSATAANIASTAAIVMGAAALGWLTERNVSARLVADDGSISLTGAWPAQNLDERRGA